MAQTGFNQKEIDDFMEYWIPLLTDHPYYAIYPQYNEQLEEMIMPVEAEIDILRDGFGDEKIYQDRELLAEHRGKFDDKTAELELLYRAYELRSG